MAKSYLFGKIFRPKGGGCKPPPKSANEMLLMVVWARITVSFHIFMSIVYYKTRHYSVHVFMIETGIALYNWTRPFLVISVFMAFWVIDLLCRLVMLMCTYWIFTIFANYKHHTSISAVIALGISNLARRCTFLTTELFLTPGPLQQWGKCKWPPRRLIRLYSSTFTFESKRSSQTVT